MSVPEILTMEAWRGYQRDTFPTGSWRHAGDRLCAVVAAERIDLITQQQYRNFVLELEWRVARGGNSGILYRVTEAMPHAWQSGPEMQLLDDTHHPDGQTPETRAGALYGLMAPWRQVVRPFGHFNAARLVVCDRRIGIPPIRRLLSRDKALPIATFDTFFPLRSARHTPPPTCGLRRIPVFVPVVSAGLAPHHPPIRIKAS